MHFVFCLGAQKSGKRILGQVKKMMLCQPEVNYSPLALKNLILLCLVQCSTYNFGILSPFVKSFSDIPKHEAVFWIQTLCNSGFG
jgi:hypothetical protein